MKLTVKCFSNGSFDKMFHFYLLVQSYHGKPLTLTQSGSEVKLWCNFGVIL